MKVQKRNFYALMYAILGFAFSMYIAPFYTLGDQFYYIRFYEECFLPGEDQWYCYTNMLGSAEPVYFFLAKLAHFFVEKTTFTSLFNALLIYLITLLVFKYYKVVWHRHIFTWLIFLNYYIYVLFFGAERLKFGFIFICLALLLTKSKRFVALILSFLSHIQMVFMITPYIINLVFKSSLSRLKKIGILAAGIVSGIGLFIVLRSHIEGKLLAYTAADDGSSNLFGVVKTAVFVILAAATTKKYDPLLAGVPLLIASFILGGERISVLAFFIYLGYVVYYKKEMDIIMAIVMLYFVYTGFNFLNNIITYGTGYLGQL